MTEGRLSAREINQGVRYTCWAVFGRTGPGADGLVDALESAQEGWDDIVVRGWYDVSGLRAGTDIMVWLHGPTAEGLQAALRDIRRALGTVEQAWSAFGVHRPAEFNKGHVPAFLAGVEAQPWLCVYPFVRSLDWYLLPDEERKHLLFEHGQMGRGYDSVKTNTVAAFALGDFEWVLALEAPELHEIVDLTRHLRASGARRHVRLEIPFHTGRLIEASEIPEVLS